MKKPFEDKEFDESIRSRLENFEAEPDDQFKKTLFTEVRESNHTLRNIVLGSLIILVLLSGYFIGFEFLDFNGIFTAQKINNLKSEGPSYRETGINPESRDEEVDIVIDSTKDYSNLKEIEKFSKAHDEELYSSPETIESSFKAGKSIVVKKEVQQQDNNQFSFSGKGNSLSLVENKQLSYDEFEKVVPQLKFTHKKRTFDKAEVIKEDNKDDKWGIYADLLTFWTYQHATPNKNDEWIVNKMKSPGLLSRERMGGRASIGVYYEITDAVEAFGGISSQLQQYHSEFQMRSLNATDFKFSEAINAYSPTYEYEQIQIDHKLWSAGAKLGMKYYLPYGEKNFWASTSLDYQRMLTEVKDDEYPLNPNQLYLNVDVGWKYQLTRRLFFNLSPSLSYTLLQNSNEEEILSIIPFSWGINLGVNLKFGK